MKNVVVLKEEEMMDDSTFAQYIWSQTVFVQFKGNNGFLNLYKKGKVSTVISQSKKKKSFNWIFTILVRDGET